MLMSLTTVAVVITVTRMITLMLRISILNCQDYKIYYKKQNNNEQITNKMF